MTHLALHERSHPAALSRRSVQGRLLVMPVAADGDGIAYRTKLDLLVLAAELACQLDLCMHARCIAPDTWQSVLSAQHDEDQVLQTCHMLCRVDHRVWCHLSTQEPSRR